MGGADEEVSVSLWLRKHVAAVRSSQGHPSGKAAKKGGRVQAAGEGTDTGRHRGRGVAIRVVVVEEVLGASRAGPAKLPPQTRLRDYRRERGCVTVAASRPILILPSQAKVMGGLRGHRHGRGRATSVGLAVANETTGAVGFAVASDAGGRPRAAKPAVGTLLQMRSRGRCRGQDCMLIAGGCNRATAAKASRFIGCGTGSQSCHGRIGQSKTCRGTYWLRRFKMRP